MNFNDIKTPEELMTYLNQYFEYGVVDKNGKKIFDSNSEAFQNACNNDWTLRPVLQILKDKIGHCYDQVEVERYWFDKHGYKTKTFWISAYQEEVENSGFCHTYLLFFENNMWKLFEHSDASNRGIFEFKSVDEAVKWQAHNQIAHAENCIKPLNRYSVCIKEFSTPPTNINMQQYLDFINTSTDFHV